MLNTPAKLDDIELTSWLLVLKYLDALGQDIATEAALKGRTCSHKLSHFSLPACVHTADRRPDTLEYKIGEINV